MNKGEFIKIVSEQSGTVQNIVEPILNVALDVIADEVANGGTVVIAGFGKFYQRQSPKTTKRNPKTGEKLIVPPTRRLKFRSSKKLDIKEGE